ncbi:MAG: ATP-binding protein [Planctomycetota bacterium]|jgi:anti-sigma regulatory factor (Ser/Thr protein kinase)|nr:ATP-binding protein [Planctomycetota bacterium]
MSNPLSVAEEPGCFRFQMAFPDAAAAAKDIAGLGESLIAYLGKRGMSSGNINSLHIAMEELLTNLAKFGRSGADSDGTVRVEGAVELGESEIVFRLKDNAGPFDPNAAPLPAIDADPMERSVGGLGIYMLFQMFKELRYRREAAGNVSEWVLERLPDKG